MRLPKGSSRTRHALTVEDVEEIAASVGPWWRPFVLVLAYCGLRPAVKPWPSVGGIWTIWDASPIERAMSEHRGRLVEQDTKTHKAGVVQVPASVLAELRAHVYQNVGADSGALHFAALTGDPIRVSNWRHRVWQPMASDLGLPAWATPYVLRHTTASLLAQSGVPVTAAAAALGHDPAIFLRTYAHHYPGDLAAVTDAMDIARSLALETEHGDG